MTHPAEFLARLAAIVAPDGRGTTRALLNGNASQRVEHLSSLSEVEQHRVEVIAEELTSDGVVLLVPDDPRWPPQVNALPSPPAYLFAWGNLHLLHEPAVGMCGSRRATKRGLDAAAYCGERVAGRGWHVVSGYAKGVDTVTHLAALRAGGGTVIVLAEGILHFRRKRVFDAVPFNDETVLVLSQFPPTQRWAAGAAMTRNGLIVTLGQALVVIEAGESGGTLNAGRQALALGRRVFALDFADDPRAGNAALIAEGGVPLRTQGALSTALTALADDTAPPLKRAV